MVITVAYPKDNLEFWLANLKTFIGDYKNPIVFFSSTGIYSKIEKTFTEENTPDFELNSRIFQLEKGLKETYPQQTILRLGGLMGDERYLSRYYIDRPLDQPGARVNYIHYVDIIGVLEIVFNNGIVGKVYNLVAPEHPKKSEVYFEQTKKIVEGVNYERIISSEKLIKELGYTFVYPNPIYFPFVKTTKL